MTGTEWLKKHENRIVVKIGGKIRKLRKIPAGYSDSGIDEDGLDKREDAMSHIDSVLEDALKLEAKNARAKE